MQGYGEIVHGSSADSDEVNAFGVMSLGFGVRRMIHDDYLL